MQVLPMLNVSIQKASPSKKLCARKWPRKISSIPLEDISFGNIRYKEVRDASIRVDTHKDNHIMQHNIEKHGFTYCGIINLANGDERLATETKY